MPWNGKNWNCEEVQPQYHFHQASWVLLAHFSAVSAFISQCLLANYHKNWIAMQSFNSSWSWFNLQQTVKSKIQMIRRELDLFSQKYWSSKSIQKLNKSSFLRLITIITVPATSNFNALHSYNSTTKSILSHHIEHQLLPLIQMFRWWAQEYWCQGSSQWSA